jgi:hypothetical protein
LHVKNRLDILNLGSESQFKISAIEMLHNNSIFSCIYRPPNGDIEAFFDRMELLLDLVFSKSKQRIISGDFNIDTLVDFVQSNQLNDIFHSFSYTNIFSELPRVQCKSSTCLNHCYTNYVHNAQIKIKKNTLGPFSIRNHIVHN